MVHRILQITIPYKEKVKTSIKQYFVLVFIVTDITIFLEITMATYVSLDYNG